MFHRIPTERVYEPISDQPSLAIPNRAMTVREIINRFRVTGELPQQTPISYGVSDPMRSDLIDRFEQNKIINQKQAELLEQQRAELIAKQDAEAKAKFEAAVEAEVSKRMSSVNQTGA